MSRQNSDRASCDEPATEQSLSLGDAPDSLQEELIASRSRNEPSVNYPPVETTHLNVFLQPQLTMLVENELNKLPLCAEPPEDRKIPRTDPNIVVRAGPSWAQAESMDSNMRKQPRQPGRHQLGGDVSQASELARQVPRRSRQGDRLDSSRSSRHRKTPYDRFVYPPADSTIYSVPSPSPYVTLPCPSSPCPAHPCHAPPFPAPPFPAPPYPTPAFPNFPPVSNFFPLPSVPMTAMDYFNVLRNGPPFLEHSTLHQLLKPLCSPPAPLLIRSTNTHKPTLTVSPSSPPNIGPRPFPEPNVSLINRSLGYEKPLDLSVAAKQLPTLLPLTKSLPISPVNIPPVLIHRAAPRTYTLTSSNTDSPFFIENTDDKMITYQIGTRMEMYKNSSEHLLGRPAGQRQPPHQSSHPTHIPPDLPEHLQYQTWPVDDVLVSDITDHIEEVETSECDAWLMAPSPDSTAIVNKAKEEIPRTKQKLLISMPLTPPTPSPRTSPSPEVLPSQ